MKKNDLKKIVLTSKVLSKEQKKDFLDKIVLTDDSNIDFFYQKFSDAEKKIENIFIAMAFKNSKDAQSLIKTLLTSINNI